MTVRLYHTDSYATTFKAIVEAVNKVDDRWQVVLDKSAFYPTSGGQLHDIGNLSGEKVVDVIVEENSIYHILESEPAFKAGDKVSGKIDWDRRLLFMQKHTGQHILSRAFMNVTGAETVSAHLGEEDNTIDLNRSDLTEKQIKESERVANYAVYENKPVHSGFVPEDKLKEIPLRKIPDRSEEKYRIIEIDNFDWSACGGTHCERTGEVGLIKIIGVEKIRGIQRFRFLAGKEAFADYSWRFEQIEKVSNLLSRHGRETFDGVTSQIEEIDRLKRQNRSLKKKLLPTLIDEWDKDAAIINDTKIISLNMTGDDFNDAKDAALGIIKRDNYIAIIIIGDRMMAAVSQNVTVMASEIIKKASEMFGGRGGGSPQFAQGGGFDPEGIKVLIAHPEKVIDI